MKSQNTAQASRVWLLRGNLVCHIKKSGEMTGSWKEPKDEAPSDLTAHCCQKRKELCPLLFPDTLFHHLPLLVSSGPP